jgi:hypothetical protein
MRFARPSIPALLLLTMLVAACDAPADLGPAARTQASPDPVLLPLDGLLAQATGAAITPATAGGLAARAARLRARAAAMQGPVQDADTRARLAGAIAAAD